MRVNPMLAVDSYKLNHGPMYPEGTEIIYSNLTCRGSRVEGVEETVFFGLQGFVYDFLINQFDEGFFNKGRAEVAAEYQRRIDNLLGPNDIGTDHITALWDLGYLPIRICAVPEGTKVPLRVPMLTIENTLPEFFWLTNYLETVMSNYLWMSITSATTANLYRTEMDEWAERTSSVPEMVQFLGHDFSMRGLPGLDAAAISGAAHLTSFVGSDSMPGIEYLEQFYAGGEEGEMVGVSVAATEHSVMCAGGADSEEETFQRLMSLHPGGILSVVSDTWDLWEVLTKILPENHDLIMSREGKLVIRPDSGDPVKIICGDREAEYDSPAYKGVVELLWDEFGGTINDKWYKELDEHVGAIYGDSITRERMQAICSGLASKGFASTNVVLGIGSFTYQYVTRDTYGMAVKATWVQINGEGMPIFKDPVTDNGVKKSARGRLAVWAGDDGLELIENASKAQEDCSVLQPVFVDGELVRHSTLMDIRRTLGTA